MKFISLILICACGNVAGPSDKNATPTAYDVHEWGLIDQSVLDGSLRLSAPGQAPLASHRGLTVLGKPVLYFHVEGEKRLTVDVNVAVAPELRLVEHWPPTLARDDQVRWEVELLGAPCSEVRAYPTMTDVACTRLQDGVCEASELPEYETEDASCLTVDETQWPLLLYRATSVHPSERPEQGVEMPLEIEAELEGTVRIRNRSSFSSPHPMFRITVRREGTHVSRVEFPAPGESVTLAPPTDDSPSDTESRQASRDALRAHGLTPSEVDAFFRAWEDQIWSAGEAVHGSLAGEEITTGGDITSALTALMGFERGRDVLIYWLPTDLIDELAPLTFDPPPRRLRRALMVRVGLS